MCWLPFCPMCAWRQNAPARGIPPAGAALMWVIRLQRWLRIGQAYDLRMTKGADLDGVAGVTGAHCFAPSPHTHTPRRAQPAVATVVAGGDDDQIVAADGLERRAHHQREQCIILGAAQSLQRGAA